MRLWLASLAVAGVGLAVWYFTQKEEEPPKNMGCLESKPDAAKVRGATSVARWRMTSLKWLC